MYNLLRRINEYFEKDLWEMDTRVLDFPRAFMVKTLRLVHASAREYRESELNLRAMSLVYSTLLALVPLLALSFSVLKALGVHNQLEGALGKFLLPLGDKGVELTQKILEFVDNMKIGVLSAIGIIVLIYTVILLIQKIEHAFNYIWKIEKPRSLTRRFSDYMSVVLTGPVLIFSALGIKALFLSHRFIQSLLEINILGTAFYLIGQTLPFIFICLSFTFIIIFVPNTKVRFRSALVGGLVSGISWQVAAWIFSSVVINSPKYIAIYSSFAVLFLFVFWLYLNWLIVLIGAEVAFCHQNLDYLAMKKDVLEITNRFREKLSFAVMYLIGYNFYHDKEKLTVNSLSSILGLPAGPVHKVVSQLESVKLLQETADDPPTYVPSRALDSITLGDVAKMVRTNDVNGRGVESRISAPAEVDQVVETIDSAIEQSLANQTIQSLIVSSDKGVEAFRASQSED
ncbi:MAG: YihY family inner membrane protein [Candidatus Dadabacteria bacterium]|nr:YihY family inner membrane protein [Candidatus Dadabacteria bacterium]